MATDSSSTLLKQSPPMSRTSSPSRPPSSLSLDLSSLPPLSTPAPPSNTLLITNLKDPAIYTPTFLAHLQDLIKQHASSGIHSFAPLRSMSRIIICFHTVEDAIQIRTVLDGENLFGDRIRVYFGTHTAIINPDDAHLTAPRLQKQFFISPPPSPPAGWEIKEEDPPNRDVHAEDLATALERLSARVHQHHADEMDLEVSKHRRPRSNTGTIVYAPEDHGHSPDLPAIAVEDTTGTRDDDISPVEPGRTITAHTARPPVELMQTD